MVSTAIASLIVFAIASAALAWQLRNEPESVAFLSVAGGELLDRRARAVHRNIGSAWTAARTHPARHQCDWSKQVMRSPFAH